MISIAVRGLEYEEVNLLTVVWPTGRRNCQLVEGGKVAGEKHLATAPISNQHASGAQNMACTEEPKTHAAKIDVFVLVEWAPNREVRNEAHIIRVVVVLYNFCGSTILRILPTSPCSPHIVAVTILEHDRE